MAYFQISQGLRGMYMPDSSYIIRADTRRELKSALEWEARDIRDAGGVGLSKRAIASLAAAAWRDRKSSNPYGFIAEYRWRYQSTGTAPYAIFVNNATRQEYKESQE